MQPQTDQPDARREALEQWVGEQLGQPVSGTPASADASFRRYFRFRVDDRSLIGMDAPPPQEDCRPFVMVDELLAQAGVHVPVIVAQDLERGFLLLSDLGTRTWLKVLNEGNADRLFPLAMEAMIRFQQASRPGLLPDYDRQLLERELALFPEWYVQRHCGVSWDASQQADWQAVCEVLLRQALAQERVFVHRDFMPRNLMDSDPNPGVIDFQDAVYGPVSYDPVCLFKDAFLSWPEERVSGWLADYWALAREAGVPVPGDLERFLLDCDLMGAQRHLKVIGIFARICHRDGKPHYLEDVPRFFAYLDAVIARRPQLAPLASLLDQVRPR